VVDDLTEKRHLEAESRLFQRMVSPKVIAQINPNKLKLGGQRTQITTLYADVRGFTSFSERTDPEVLVSVLNRYLAAAAEAILAEDGTIDKFMGDAIMAWFNAPIPQPDHILRAIRSGIGISKSLKSIHQELASEFHLGFGIGIHYGEAVLGLLGTESRLDYTAIGHSVNTAKRIQENASSGQILISEDVYRKVAEHLWVRQVEPVNAKGISHPIVVYEVLGIK
jgi:class 3 adenylate cyclase